MTLDTHQGARLLEKRLTERSERFQKECEALDIDKACGGRLTAISVGGDIQGVRLLNGEPNKNLHIPWGKFTWKESGSSYDLFFPSDWCHRLQDWKPDLRFSRAEKSANAGKSYAEIHWDGLLELGCVFDPLWGGRRRAFFQLDWLFALFATLAAWADCVRKEVGVPTAEYALYAEIYSNSAVPLLLEDSSRDPYRGELSEKNLEPGFKLFPRYPLGNSNERRKLLALFMQDCWDLGGKSFEIKEDDIEIKPANEK